MTGTRLGLGRFPRRAAREEPDAPVVEVPDLVEPIVAWRLWHLAGAPDGARLSGLFQSTPWSPGEPVVATCQRRRLRRQRRHEVPDRRCQCGIYGTELELVGRSLALRLSDPPRRTDLVVLGRVALWGTVLECARGYRAAYAYPVDLHVLGPLHERLDGPPAVAVAGDLAVYRVPVDVLDAGGLDALLPDLDVSHDVMAQPGRWLP